MHKTQKNSGFTLIELLVVVAIIAVIGAGVAVTYRNLDEKAKVSMEMSDIGTLQKTISHWSFINDNKIPDGLDSLIDQNGDLYHCMDTSEVSNVAAASQSGMGLYGPIAYTAMVQEAPDMVLNNLAYSGLSKVYIHLIDDKNVTVANDSTYVSNMIGGGVDTTDSLYTLDTDASTFTAEQAAYINTNSETLLSTFNTDGSVTINWADATGGSGSVTYSTLSALNSAIETAEAIVNGNLLDKLAFIYPGGGATISMGPMGSYAMAMNLTDEIITNCGLTNDQVADPTVDNDTNITNGKEYYLVVMGLGRFASINNGKAVRIDNPAFGHRQAQDDSIYSRYLVVLRVPTEECSSMTNSGEGVSVAAVLSPQGYSVAALRDKYITTEDKLKD